MHYLDMLENSVIPNASEYHVEVSKAVSLKRIADALEQNNFIQSEILEQMKWMPKT
jgi:thiazole synthase ThiGH ThiG subunit